MAAVTQTITNFLGGVSNQPDDKKLPGQVRDALNSYPDPTFGLTKRPGLKFLAQLTDGSSDFDNNDLDNAKWFYYNRASDESYVGCVVGVAGSPHGLIHVWNTADLVKATINYHSSARAYLNAVNATDYDVLTVRDTTYIVNKTKTITTVAGDSFTANARGTVRIHFAEYSQKYTVTVDGSNFVLNTYAANTASGDSDVTNFLSANDILTGLKDGSNTGGTYSGAAGGLNGISGITAEIIGSSLELTGSSAFTLTVSGGRSGESLTSYQDEVDTSSELSSQSKNGRIVTIKHTTSTMDTYYAKFVAANNSAGDGNWEETLKPGATKGVTDTTMPHHLYRTAKNTFSFTPINGVQHDGSAAADGSIASFKWIARTVGDDDTNEDPSFVGNTIQQAFFYNNRLGFLTEDNVSMSKAGAFYDFYMTSAQTTTDADPIDISCSSTKPANLHAIIPSAGGLMLFSQNQQFIMFSADGNLKPSTALIRTISNYKMDTYMDPVDLGTQINFVSKTHTTAGFTRIFTLISGGAGATPTVVDIGRLVSEYIPVTVDSLMANPQNDFIAMYGRTIDKIYFFRKYSDGEKDVMQTWFNWQLPGNIHYATTDSDTLYSVVKTGTGAAARYVLCSATLTQTPEETIIVTSDGQQVNPHMDFYTATSAVNQYPIESVTITNGGSGYSGTPTVAIAAPASGTQATATATVAGNAVTAITITNPGKGYDPANPPAVTFSGGGGSNAAGTAVVYDGSYCQIPFKDVTTLTPVIVISGNATSNFSGTTESGFTITPSRTTVGANTYFTVPAKDLAAQAANVYVGYKYNFDITLPKIYFRPEANRTDFTANLTVARCKFSIGKSSVVGFKLKRKGVQAVTQTFTGDGSTVAFSPDFTVKDKADVIVKKAGAKQILTTDYTIADHATIPDRVTVTFGSAPSAAVTAGNVTTPAESVEIYVDEWFTLIPTQEANYYLGDDVPIEEQNTFIVPIHQRSDNYTLRVFSDSPFPVALTSMSWEGNYSPRYYRRT